jgi:hypothetical protein
MRIRLLAALLVLFPGCAAAAQENADLPKAYSFDQDEWQAAVDSFRAQGPGGLDALLTMRDRMSADYDTLKADPGANGKYRLARLQKEIERLNGAIDAVGGARYCSVSRLYWYTDLEEAREAARQSGKPILSLRMLGKLTDEYSCANSRFFRTALYSNAEIAKYLRENYVLHWKSVRPVPRVTIDFGDGRKLERTLTGNSIHYVLDAGGRPIDGLPGLYGPAAFLDWLNRSKMLATSLAGAETQDRRNSLLSAYHAERGRTIAEAWKADLEKVGIEVPTAIISFGQLDIAPGALAGAPPLGQPAQGAVPAPRAAALAVTKSRVEVPMLDRIVLDRASLESATDWIAWEKIAALRADEARLDASSIGVIRRENPDAERAGDLAQSKRVVESPLLRMVRNFESSIALDGVRNEYLLHGSLHGWFESGAVPDDVESLNERVYAELFLTPGSDPWLGLVPASTYTALENGGVESGGE